MSQADDALVQKDDSHAGKKAIGADQAIPPNARGLAVADLHEPLGIEFKTSGNSRLNSHRQLLYHCLGNILDRGKASLRHPGMTLMLY